MKKINIIWLVRSQYEVHFSFEWIQEIFSEFQIENHYDLDNNFNLFLNNSILIVCVGKNENPRLIDYIESYNTLGHNYSVLHLSDEAFEQNIDFYSVSKKIMRNYFNPKYNSKFNILTIPLGYQTGIKKYEIDKDIDVNFAGQIKSDRHQMISNFRNRCNLFLHLTNQWADPNGLDIDNYSRILSRSWFTLCPRGWVNLDSFRINEALECGSIPISVLDTDGSDYFRNVYGQHPFIIGKDWLESFEIYSNCDKIKLSNEISDWWNDYKSILKVKINKFLEK